MEPEILIVDEVLAVGDAEFQKKCMGKMDEITKSHGRTILFVSHNMAAVQNLCTRSILLEHGKIVKTGKTSDIVSYYLSDRIKRSELSITPKNSEVGVTKAWFEDERGEKVSSTEMGENIYLKLEYITKKEIPVMDIGCVIYKEGVAIFGSHRSDFKNEFERSVKPGAYLSSVKLPTSILKEGIYTLKIIIGTDRNVSDPNASMKFEITNTLVDTTSKSYHPEREGLLYTNLEWKTERISST
jgi:lipopolysaccharide transport system ATP-binding protein